MKLKQTYMIDGKEVESEGVIVNDLRVFSYKNNCQYDPEIILYFVNKEGEVLHNLYINAYGGPEGCCRVDVSWSMK